MVASVWLLEPEKRARGDSPDPALPRHPERVDLWFLHAVVTAALLAAT